MKYVTGRGWKNRGLASGETNILALSFPSDLLKTAGNSWRNDSMYDISLFGLTWLIFDQSRRINDNQSFFTNQTKRLGPDPPTTMTESSTSCDS